MQGLNLVGWLPGLAIVLAMAASGCGGTTYCEAMEPLLDDVNAGIPDPARQFQCHAPGMHVLGEYGKQTRTEDGRLQIERASSGGELDIDELIANARHEAKSFRYEAGVKYTAKAGAAGGVDLGKGTIPVRAKATAGTTFNLKMTFDKLRVVTLRNVGQALVNRPDRSAVSVIDTLCDDGWYINRVLEGTIELSVSADSDFSVDTKEDSTAENSDGIDPSELVTLPTVQVTGSDGRNMTVTSVSPTTPIATTAVPVSADVTLERICASQCGGNGRKACAGRVSDYCVSSTQMTIIDGTCHWCGQDGERVCDDPQNRCSAADLVEQQGRCVRCGARGKPACRTPVEGTLSCKHALVPDNEAVCRRCGRAGLKTCSWPGADLCRGEGLYAENGTCREYGRPNARPRPSATDAPSPAREGEQIEAALALLQQDDCDARRAHAQLTKFWSDKRLSRAVKHSCTKGYSGGTKNCGCKYTADPGIEWTLEKVTQGRRHGRVAKRCLKTSGRRTRRARASAVYRLDTAVVAARVGADLRYIKRVCQACDSGLVIHEGRCTPPP